MLILFIIGLLLGAVAVIFSLQNVVVITVSFFSYQLTGSLAVILLLAITSGILICLLILLPGAIQNSIMLGRLRKENKKLEEELRKQKELTFFAKQTPPSGEDITHIEEGAIANPNKLY